MSRPTSGAPSELDQELPDVLRMVEEMDQLGMHSSHSVANALVEFQILAREQCQTVFACGLKVASVCKNQRLRLSATLHMQMASQSSLTPLHNQKLTPCDLLNGKLVAYATAMQSVYDNWHGGTCSHVCVIQVSKLSWLESHPPRLRTQSTPRALPKALLPSDSISLSCAMVKE